MRHLRARLALTTAAVVAAGLALSACGASSNPTVAASTPAGSASGAATSAVIGSADFSESQILAEVYAAALNAKGIKATTRPNIGSREVYLKAIQDGSVDIVPEYTGSLLNYLDKTATAKAPDEVYAALGKAVPTGLVALDKSAAEDKNSIVVTKDTAAKWSLTQIGDLVAHQAEIVVAAPPEFQTRVQGLPGLKDVYSFVPKDFARSRARPSSTRWSTVRRRRRTSSPPTCRSSPTGSSRWPTRRRFSAPTTSCRWCARTRTRLRWRPR
jgi:osmoprotectant transport system substrate-binding protein